jgi:hypothetical protein
MTDRQLGDPQSGAGLTNIHVERARPIANSQRQGLARRLADEGRRRTDPAARSAGIFVGIVNGAPVVIFSIAQPRRSDERSRYCPGQR